MRFQDNQIWCVDGQRAAVETNRSLCVDEPFMLRAESLVFLREFHQHRGELAVGKQYVSIQSHGLTLFLTRMNEDHITLDRIMPQNFTETYTVDRKQYLDALNYLRDCGGGSNRAKIVFENGALRLTGKNGRYQAEIDRTENCKTRYACDLGYLRDAMRQFDSRNHVQIFVVDEKKPVVLTDGHGASALIMTQNIEDGTVDQAA